MGRDDVISEFYFRCDMRKMFLFLICLWFTITVFAGNPVHEKMPYALNVVYFVPKGMQPVEQYERRLSDILFYVQKFYREEMQRNGFGEKTFGLNKNPDGTVKLLIIEGEKSAEAYPYEGGGGKVQVEIEKWFRLHPTEKTSDHILVFMPTTTGNENPGGVPFYGLGKICFALDYKYFDLKYLGDAMLTKWLGGMAHELGHGLNLPHNSQTVSGQKALGTSLMGAGNYTFGMKPTFLTPASCGILNNCQVFATQKKDFYGKEPEMDIRNLHIEFKEKSIDIRGGFKLSLPCNGINIYYDNAPYGSVNTDYDAESFFVRPGKDTFSFSIPKSELFHFAGQDFQIRIGFLCTNGTVYYQSCSFWKDKIADAHFEKKRELPKAGWKASASDEQPGAKAAQVLDGKISTIWHSAWYPYKKGFPHKLTVTLNEEQRVKGISVQQRPGLHGAVKECILYLQTDGEWTKAGTYTLQNHSLVQYIDLPHPTKLTAFTLECLSNHNPEDPLIASFAEIGAY